MKPTIYEDGMPIVETLLPAARARLVTLADDAPLVEAAKLLRVGIDLVIVCNHEGFLSGVLTKTDVVSRISGCLGSSCVTAVSLAMTRNVVSCVPADRLQDVWTRMKTQGLKNVPVIDQDCRPIGVLNARDALQALLQEVQDEESLLRDYVMGIGYH
jgi:CBS domain-containing protein